MQSDAREMLVAALSGGTGSGVAKIFTYPLEISKTRLMNKPGDQTSWDCLRELLRTGWYIGFKEKVTKSFIQKFIYFYLYEALLATTMQAANEIRKFRSLSALVRPSNASLLCSGYLGEALGIPLFAPLEYIAVQVQNSPSRESAVSIIQRTLRTSGMQGFYRGWQVYLLCAFQPMVQFTLIERFKAMILRGQDRQTAKLSVANAFWLGALTKAVASSLTYPINLGRVMIQSSTSGRTNGELKSQETNIFRVLQGVVAREGVLGLYKGLANEVVEGLLGAAILLVVKEQVTAFIRKGVYAALR